MKKDARIIEEKEKRITRLYFRGQISPNKYQTLLRKIQEVRHRADIEGKGNKMSMSSTKWK